jgi:putative oxidoreductase
MKIFEWIARIALGLLFVIVGCNGFVAFLPAPPLQGLAGQFLYTLSVSHYDLVVSGFQVLGGMLLILNRFVSLAIAILAPVIVNILCFHIFMMPSGLTLAILVAVIWSFLAYQHRRDFAGLFVSRH